MSFTISGIARDRNGDVVPGAITRFYNSTTKALVGTATANGKGKWSIALASGTYDVLDNDGDRVNGFVVLDVASQALTAWSTGAGAPSDLDGADGDLYTDTTAKTIYIKVSGSWALKYTPPTQTIPAWTTGVVAPDNSAGSNGDFYTDTVAGKIYYKSAGAWANVATFALPV